MSSDYHFVTVWRVRATCAEVMAILGDGPALTRWWPSVYLAADVLDEGGAEGMGARMALHTKGWLPYTLQWVLTTVEPGTPNGFALTASGDLNGTGRWRFEQVGPDVAITYDWQVHAAKPLLRRLSWLLRRAFSANHHWAMARGYESLQLELLRRRAASDPAALRRIPAPPAPTRTRLSQIQTGAR